MIRKLLIAVCLMACASSAFALGKLQGYVEQGGNSVTVAGFLSQTKVQKSYPAATVTVYLTGTSTLATIYADSALTAKANPFTAASDGKWEFYAADGDYDVRFSGGGIAVPYTWSGLQIGTGAGEGVSVTAYGAVCDNVVDDTLAIRAAIAAAGTTNVKKVVFPARTCRVTTDLVAVDVSFALFKLTNGIILEGVAGSSTIRFDGTFPTSGTGSTGFLMFGVEQGASVEIRDMKFTGLQSNAYATRPFHFLWHFGNGGNFRMTRCTVDTFDAGVKLNDMASGDVLIDYNTITNMTGTGILSSAYDGGVLADRPSFKILYNNISNIGDAVDAPLGDAIYVVSPSKDALIRGNRISDVGTGITVKNDAVNLGTNSYIISENWIYNACKWGAGGSSPIAVSGTGTYYTEIIGNHIQSTPSGSFININVNQSNTVVAYNTIATTGTSNLGIYLQGATGSVVTGNMVTLGSAGVAITSNTAATDAVISHNRVRFGAASSSNRGVLVQGAGFSVDGNDINPNSGIGVLVTSTSAANVSITSNRFSGTTTSGGQIQCNSALTDPTTVFISGNTFRSSVDVAWVISQNGTIIGYNSMPVGMVATISAGKVATWFPADSGAAHLETTLQITNTAGTLQHRFIADTINNTTRSLFDAKIVGASAVLSNTPSVSAAVAFVAGGGIDAAAAHIFRIDTAAQVIGADLISAKIVSNTTATTYDVDCTFVSTNVNGVTRVRPALVFRNPTTGAAVTLTTANIPAGTSLYVKLTGRLR